MGLWYASASGHSLSNALSAAAAPACASAVAFGMMLQLVAWLVTWRSARFSGLWLAAASAGALLMMLGVAVYRETMRLAAVDLAALSIDHADAASKGGLVVFVLFAVVNTVVIAMCFAIVRRGRAAQTRLAVGG